VDSVEYLHLSPGAQIPALKEAEAFQALVLVEAEVSQEWQIQVSDWLVRSGCLYMMAWGRKCRDWDTSVDESNIALVDGGEFPKDHFVMTTWHEDEPLEEVFWFSMTCAFDDNPALEKTYILHIAPESRTDEILGKYREVQDGIGRE